MVPPAPNSESSGCAVTTRTFSILSGKGRPPSVRRPISAYRFRVRRVNSYNRVMPIAAPRRVGVAGLLGLLAGALVLMFAPCNPGALRVIGIGLFWWYAALAAPLAAVLLVVSTQGLAVRSGSAHHSMVLAIAAWTSPVLL